jgi:uncharacterized protein (TIGR02001 family)
MPVKSVPRLIQLLYRPIAMAVLAGPAAAHTALPESDLKYILSARITSEYVVNGISQSGGKPSFQPFFEMDWRGLYGGVAISYVRLLTDRTEFDLYIGHRRRLANDIFFDLSYRRFLLNSSGNCCGEAKARVIFPVGERIGAELLLAYNHNLDNFNHRARALWDVTDRLDLFGSLGETSLNDNQYWNVGATYSLPRRLAVSLRYEGAETGDPGFIVSLGWSTINSDIARLFIDPFQ